MFHCKNKRLKIANQPIVDNMKNLKVKRVAQAIAQSWSLGSSTKWKQSNPALGQCGVTALVAHDHLGGEILKTWVVKSNDIKLWHFYNFIDKEAIDFTISQFDEPINYDHRPSSRAEAFMNTNASQYDCLSAKFRKCFNDIV